MASAEPVHGGDVNVAARVVTGDGPVFVKWREGAPPDLFEAEADGLRALGEVGALRVPRVLHVSREPAFLVLEYIASTIPSNEPAFSCRFGKALATLHRSTIREDFGYSRDNYLGGQPQESFPFDTSWANFYVSRRLLPQMALGIKLGRIGKKREWALMDVLNVVPDILGDMPNESSLIHGDLWSGNFLCAANDEPVLIDPAVYYAPREMEIAYVGLFGGFPSNFVANYDAAYPLDSGYARRRSLHTLYPLLIHLNHFGEKYGPAVDRICAEYGSG